MTFPEFARYFAVLKEMAAGGLSPEEVEWLRALFDRFDGNADGELTMKECADLLRNCFPSRAKDTKKLMAEIKAADLNKDGQVSCCAGLVCSRHGRGAFEREKGCLVDGAFDCLRLPSMAIGGLLSHGCRVR